MSAARSQQPPRAPRLIGLDTASAIRVLLLTRPLRGVPHLVVYPSSALVPIDSIIAQSPLPDSIVRGGDTIRLILGARTVVPQLIGRTEPEVVKILEAARLRGQAGTAPASADSELGRVVRQSADSGTQVAPFTSIAYFLGFDARFAMPSVIGRTLADARAMLRDSGLTFDVGARAEAGSGTLIDSVAVQDPPPGTRIWPSAPVVLTLGRRPVVVAGSTAAGGTVTPTPVNPPEPRPRPNPVPPPVVPPPRVPWLLIALAAAVVVLTGAALTARAAWVPTVTSRAALRGFAPRLAADAPSIVAAGLSLRARVDSKPSRVAVTGSRSLLA